MMDKLSKELFGDRSVNVTYAPDREDLVKQAELRLFGRNFERQEYAEVVAALNHATLLIDYSEGDDEIIIEATHPLYEINVRSLTVITEKKTIHNILFEVARPPAPPGVGARITARQVEMARRLGFDQILVIAGGRPGDAFNGYYTWPRLGYNMNISEMRAELDASGFFGVEDTNTLLRRPNGKAWWKNNGKSGPCIFDLSPDSSMRRALEEYLKDENIVVVE